MKLATKQLQVLLDFFNDFDNLNLVNRLKLSGLNFTNDTLSPKFFKLI